MKHFIVSALSCSCIGDDGFDAVCQIADTIEKRIRQIQLRKSAIVKEAFKGQGSSDSESMENLKIMFGED